MYRRPAARRERSDYPSLDNMATNEASCCENQHLNKRSEVCKSGDTKAKLLDAICCQVASYSLGEAPGQGPSETSHSGAPGIPCSSCIFQADLYATTAA